MFAIGLFHNGCVGHAKSFPHLREAGPVVTFPPQYRVLPCESGFFLSTHSRASFIKSPSTISILIIFLPNVELWHGALATLTRSVLFCLCLLDKIDDFDS